MKADNPLTELYLSNLLNARLLGAFVKTVSEEAPPSTMETIIIMKMSSALLRGYIRTSIQPAHVDLHRQTM